MSERPTAMRSTTRTTERGPTQGSRRKPHKGHSRASAITSVGATFAPEPLSEEFLAIRVGLDERLTELRSEYRGAMVELRDLQRTRETATAGDDHTDAGTKTFEREQELTLAHGILERIDQVERAIVRIDEGTYGQCEQCGDQIGPARLEAYPAVTLCVACKQRQERR